MKALLVLVVIASVLSACGPQQTSQEKDDQQVAEKIRQQKELLAPLVGNYAGNMTKITGETMQMGLILTILPSISGSTTRFDTTEVPTIGGSFSVCQDEGKCFESLKKPGPVFTAAVFNAGKYEKSTGHLALTYQAGGTSSNEPGGIISIDAIVQGDVIKGNLNSARLGPLGTFEVKRMK